MKKTVLFLVVFLFASLTPGCSIVKEGITGERPIVDEGEGPADDDPGLPAAYNIIGDWFGVYDGGEWLGLLFTEDGKCELQPAVYPSDVFGPRYYGNYRWGGDGGREILLDLYRGVVHEVDFGDGNIRDEWSDGGRESATTALTMSFRVYGGGMKSAAIKAVSGGPDTEGYTVVQPGALLVLLAQPPGGGNPSTFVFGSAPYDQTEGKKLSPSPPDILTDKAMRFFTTAELNVRCGPDTSYGTYGTVPVGTPVDKIGEKEKIGDWAFVLLENGGGWVNTDYLSETRPTEG